VKNIFIILCMFLSFSVIAAPDPSCSLKGTRVLYTNGINTSYLKAGIAMFRIKELGSMQENQNFNLKIDSKKLIYVRAYNHSEGIAADILESAVQRLPKSYLDALHVSNVYAAYSHFLNGKLIQSISSSIINSIIEKKLEIYSNFAKNYYSEPSYNDSIDLIRSKYKEAFDNGERIFALSHSQGSLFVNDVYNLLPEDTNKKKYFTAFQIASVLNSEMNTRFGYATNPRDMIVNMVREEIGALSANLTAPLIISNLGFDSDLILNHGVITVYLYDSTLRSQVISKLIETANKQVSNCFYANIDYTKNKLQVQFNSKDPQDRNPNGLKYIWSFGDSQTAETEEELFSHIYSKAGNYIVTLTVKDESGASETATKTIQVDDMKAVINYTKNDLVVNFNSTDPQNPSAEGLTYSWSFGDGQVLTTQSKTITHTYSKSGSYAVKLVVADEYGVSVEATVSITLSGETAIYTFCNSGVWEGNEMNFLVENTYSFTLNHSKIAPKSRPNICECKKLELPKKAFHNVVINGQNPRYVYFWYERDVEGVYPRLYGNYGGMLSLVINPGAKYWDFTCDQMIYK